MAYTDHLLDGTVWPQDGGNGTTDANADWTNACLLGGLAIAEGVNYKHTGLEITPDWANNNFELGWGLAFVKDERDQNYRDPSDSEQERNGLWTLGSLTIVKVPWSYSGLPLENTSGENIVFLHWTYDGNNDLYCRVADDWADAPDEYFLLGEIYADTQTYKELYEYPNGLQWEFLGYTYAGSLQDSLVITPKPAGLPDELLLKMSGIYGDATSSIQLQLTVNDVTSGYNYRTTQGNVGGDTKVNIAHAVPANTQIAGDIAMTCNFINNAWAFSNRQAGATSKYVAFFGNNEGMADSEFKKATLKWSTGQIRGYLELWGRSYKHEY